MPSPSRGAACGPSGPVVIAATVADRRGDDRGGLAIVDRVQAVSTVVDTAAAGRRSGSGGAGAAPSAVCRVRRVDRVGADPAAADVSRTQPAWKQEARPERTKPGRRTSGNE